MSSLYSHAFLKGSLQRDIRPIRNLKKWKKRNERKEIIPLLASVSLRTNLSSRSIVSCTILRQMENLIKCELQTCFFKCSFELICVKEPISTNMHKHSGKIGRKMWLCGDREWVSSNWAQLWPLLPFSHLEKVFHCVWIVSEPYIAHHIEFPLYTITIWMKQPMQAKCKLSHQWPSSTAHAQTITDLQHGSWSSSFWIMSPSFPSLCSSLSIILI